MSMVFLELDSTSTFLLALLFYSSFFNTYHNSLHIFPHLLLLPATSNSLSLILLSFTFLYVQLLVYHNITRLFPLSILHSLTHTPFLFFSIKSPSICYSFLLTTFTSTFFISSTTLTISSSLPLALFIFSTISTSSPSITTSCKLHG